MDENSPMTMVWERGVCNPETTHVGCVFLDPQLLGNKIDCATYDPRQPFVKVKLRQDNYSIPESCVFGIHGITRPEFRVLAKRLVVKLYSITSIRGVNYLPGYYLCDVDYGHKRRHCFDMIRNKFCSRKFENAKRAKINPLPLMDQVNQSVFKAMIAPFLIEYFGTMLAREYFSKGPSYPVLYWVGNLRLTCHYFAYHPHIYHLFLKVKQRAVTKPVFGPTTVSTIPDALMVLHKMAAVPPFEEHRDLAVVMPAFNTHRDSRREMRCFGLREPTDALAWLQNTVLKNMREAGHSRFICDAIDKILTKARDLRVDGRKDRTRAPLAQKLEFALRKLSSKQPRALTFRK